MKVKEESEKAGLKLNIQKMKIMASGLITSLQIDGETMETVTDFIFLGSKIILDSDCSHEINRCLLLRRKAMTKLDCILKSRDITLPTKVRLVKANGFSSSHVCIWELNHKESWVLKNWCFWFVVLEKTLWGIHVDIWQNQYNIVKLKNKIIKKKSPLDSKGIKSIILKEVNLEYGFHGKP